MIRILAIAPYEGLADSLIAEAKSRSDLQLTVKTGNLQSGVEIAKSSFYASYDVVISRGGTAHLLKQQLDIPIIEIPISVYDMLRAIKLAENYSDKCAIIGYENITRCAHTLCDLLQQPIDAFTIDNTSDILQLLTDLKEKNYQMILCDMVTSTKAHQAGMNSILITSGPESIQTAFNDAINLYNSHAFITMQKELFRNIIFESHLNILLFDDTQTLAISSFEEHINAEDMKQYIQQHLSEFLLTPDITMARKHKSSIWEIRCKPLFFEKKQFTAIYLTEKNSISHISSNGIYCYTFDELLKKDPYGFCGSASYVGNMGSIISDYSNSTSPVLITGESGTGKDKSAMLLYQTGIYKDNLFYIIDCKLVPEKKWTSLLESPSSPFNCLYTTIHLKDIHYLSDATLTKLSTFLKESNVHKRNRMLFTINTYKFNLKNPVVNYLMNQMSCLTLHIPPLRERREDIPNIASICINQLNTLLGKTLVGFDAEAMGLLQSFAWPQNLDQFKRALKELVISAHSPYISTDAVQHQLKKELSSFSPSDIDLPINLNQSLNEINYDIIHMVLNEEDGNKSKTADRLNISRSTLWRILKLHN